jgi:hypothetical protein
MSGSGAWGCEVAEDRQRCLVLHPAEPGRGIGSCDELGELTLLGRRERSPEEASIGQVVKGKALNSTLINGIRAGHQHFVDERGYLREFRTR